MPEFGLPSLLLLASAVPLAAAFLVLGFQRRRWALRRFLGEVQGSRLVAGHVPVWRVTRAGLLLAGLALLVVAAARPQWGTEPNPLARQGADIVVVLDASLSMAATDVEPNRMAYAQEALGRALDSLQGDRIGLVLFGADARLRFPLTTDIAAAKQVIRLTQPGDPLVSQGTAVGPAIAEAARTFDSESDDRGRVVILVTDGENLTEADPPLGELRQRDAVLYTVGVGTPVGSTIPTEDPRTGATEEKIDPDTGLPVVTRLDEPFLQQLARAGGGRYYRLQNGDDLSGLVAEIDQLENARLAEGERDLPVERYQWFLAPAAVLLMAAFFLPETPSGLLGVRLRRWRPGSAVPLLALLALAAPLAASCQQSVESLNQEGNRRYQDSRYDEALEAYQEAQVKRPDLAELHYNTGNALHRLGEYDRAAEETRRALGSPDPVVRFRAYYALGNHFYRLGRLEEAYDAYKNALREDPADRDAKINLELVLAQMQQQREQQPPPDGQPPPEQQPAPPGQEQPPRPGQGPPQPPGGGEANPPPDAEADTQVQEAIRDFQESGSIEDAIRVLEAIQERERRRQESASQDAGENGGGIDW